jgi:hypothetical protein
MLKIFLILNILFINLWACKGGYKSCRLKMKNSSSVVKNTLQIPVLKNKLLIYSKETPNKKIIKYDPFLSLYLVEDKKHFKYPFRINYKLSLGVASVNNKKATEGKIKKRQIGLNSFASFSEPVKAPSLLLNSCCALEGIVTPDGIIEKDYIEHFLKTKNVVYGNIGIRVENKNKLVLVKYINPFIKNIPFKIGDSIVLYDGKKVKYASAFMKKILFSKIGSTHTLKIKRLNKFYTFKVKTIKRYGGGYLSDTFLEFKGLYLDKNLKLIKILKNSIRYGLHLGDRLLKVNNIYIYNQSELRKNIPAFDDKALLLLERDNFEFFMHIN